MTINIAKFYRLLRFGQGDQLYRFPPASTFWDNFSNVVPRTTRLPGTSGGFDEYGDAPAPTEIGKVDATWWLIADDDHHITSLVDEVKGLVDWGVQKLLIQPYDTSQRERWCYARVNNASLPENADKCPDKQMKVSMTLQVSDPFWYNLGTESPLYGDSNSVYGGFGVVYGGSTSLPINGVGLLTNATITAGGNATTLGRITVTIPTGKTATNLTIQRLVGGVVRDELKYTATLVAGDVMVINSREASIKLNNVDAFNTSFSFLHPDWMRIRPGVNSIRVKMNNPSDEAVVRIQFYERYR